MRGRRRTERRRGLLLALAMVLGLPGIAAAQTDSAVRRMAQDLVPAVERATGVTFRRPPRVAVRTRDQLGAYLEAKTRQEFSVAERRTQERVYKAFGVIADSVNLLQTQLNLLQEQIAGFFDPDSGTLFVIRGGDAMMLRAVISHELVHALQDQYMRLAPILKMRRQNDRQMAAQAILEGQATLAGILALTPGTSASQISQSWGMLRQAVRAQAENASGAFGNAPRILRESLIFPYINGAEFMVFYEERRTSPDEMPYGERMPTTTEQILHPSRYTARETGLELAFARTRGDTVLYEDNFGEFEMKVILETWGLGEPDAISAASGWNGDRYQVRGTRGGTVILWAASFDSPQDAADFERHVRRVWERGRGRSQQGNRFSVETRQVAGKPVVVLTDAPAGWAGWSSAPAVTGR